MAGTGPPPPPPLHPTAMQTGLIVTVNGTQFDVTPDPPPAPGQSWGALNTTLPPLSIADTPGATTPALQVWGAIYAEGLLHPGPTLRADASAYDAVAGASTGGNGVHGYATSNNNSGVLGEHSDAGTGVSGTSQSGAGVAGSSTAGSASLAPARPVTPSRA